MRRIHLVSSLCAVAGTILMTGTALAQSWPEFRLGFETLAEQIPDIVGQPLEDEHWGPNGDSLQQTTTGLMVWRKADNWTAFTDGSESWVSGPLGVQRRSNGEWFGWEDQNPRGSGDLLRERDGDYAYDPHHDQTSDRDRDGWPAEDQLLTLASDQLLTQVEEQEQQIPQQEQEQNQNQEREQVQAQPGSGEQWQNQEQQQNRLQNRASQPETPQPGNQQQYRRGR